VRACCCSAIRATFPIARSAASSWPAPGAIVDDAVARDVLLHAEEEEASVPYDPEVELVVEARAVSGMRGGGAFDADGKFVGVMVRGTTTKVDGKYFTRVVRASFIRAHMKAALDETEAGLRERIGQFLPPGF
jgi:hypothetical protein